MLVLLQELTTDELIICLEQELLKPLSEKRAIDDSPPADSEPTTPGLLAGNTVPVFASISDEGARLERKSSQEPDPSQPVVERGEHIHSWLKLMRALILYTLLFK